MDATWLLLEHVTETPEDPSTYRRHLANILSQVTTLFTTVVTTFVFPIAVRYNMGTNDSSLISSCLFEHQTTCINTVDSPLPPLLVGGVTGRIQTRRLKLLSPHRWIGSFSKNHTKWRHSSKYVPVIHRFEPSPCFAHY